MTKGITGQDVIDAGDAPVDICNQVNNLLLRATRHRRKFGKRFRDQFKTPHNRKLK